MPVYLNEPISMLQRFSEVWDYKEQLTKANNEKDEFKRLAYVFSFFTMNLTKTLNRSKKPFNPLLGETYEYRDGTFFAISEQISQNPPVSALYGENEHFKVSCYIEPKTKFKLTKLEVSPRYLMIISLKATKEKFIISRPKTSVHNILKGNLYIWNYGEMSCLNINTGSKAILKLKEHSMWKQLDYTTQGEIYDAEGCYIFSDFLNWITYLNRNNLLLVKQKGKSCRKYKNCIDIFISGNRT